MNRFMIAASLFAATLSFGATAEAAKTLVFCSEGSPEGFNAAFFTAGTTFDASSVPLFNRLVEFQRGTTVIVPGLAERWEISADGKTYTFFLRKGVKFHTSKTFTPTRDFNADDVLFSFNRQRVSDHPYHKVGGGSYEYFTSMGMDTLIKDIVKVDEHTVRFELTQPEAPFIANMAMDFASIFPAEYAEAMLKAGTPDRVDHEPVGTGPFQLVAYQKDSQIRYRAFDSYWSGRAPIDVLVFAITPDPAVRYAKLQKGECHVMPYPNPSDLAAMAKDPAINLMQQPGLNIGYLAFNTEKKPFDDSRVRRALSLAVNKQAIVDAVYQGAGQVAKNPIPPTIWSYNDSVVEPPYDPAAAKAALAEAGFPNGFTTDLWAMPVQRPYNPNARRVAEMVQADWSQIGVKASIVSFEWGEYLKRSKNGEHQTLLLGWTGDNGDPDNFLHTLLSCDAVGSANRARWCYKPFNDLVIEAKLVADPAARTALYRDAQAVFKDQTPWITLAHSVVYEPIRKEVKNYRISPFGKHDFYQVDLE